MKNKSDKFLSLVLVFKKLGDNKNVKKLLPFSVMFLVFIIYLIYNLRFVGPAYLSDEIGYLTKAIKLSGGLVDSASSWHGGYSLLILPAFLLFNNPLIQWKAVLVLNALMWAGSAGFLFYILRSSFPKKNYLTIAFATLITFAYPSFVSMSAYAFSTTGFVLVFMLLIYVLIKGDFKDKKYILLASLAAGSLYWVHPLGISAIIATGLIFICRAIYEKCFKIYIIPIAILVIMPIIYTFLIHPWFNASMVPDGFVAVNHYTNMGIFNIWSNITQPIFWARFFTILLGQVSYLLVASFGMLGLSVYWIFSNLVGGGIKKGSRQLLNNPIKTTLLAVLMGLLVVIFITALSSASSNNSLLRADFWIYGRYAEMFILPLIGIGILSTWKPKILYFCLGITITTGLIMFFAVNPSSTNLSNINYVNIQSFWPMLFVKEANYPVAFLFGSFGILVISMASLLKKGKAIVFVMVLPLLFLTVSSHKIFHQSILYEYSAPPNSLRSLITQNYQKGGCVGRGLTNKSERFNLYTYYLNDYNFYRMSPESWLKECGGPYLTFDTNFLSDLIGVKVIARDVRTGMYVIVHNEDLGTINIDNIGYDLYINLDDEDCVLAGCFNWEASPKSYTQIGQYNFGSLSTTGRAGLLIYGPYAPIKKGTYSLVLDGDFNGLGSVASLEITTEKGSISYLNADIIGGSRENMFRFSIDKDVDDLEVRIVVDQNSNITLRGYKLFLNSPKLR